MSREESARGGSTTRQAQIGDAAWNRPKRTRVGDARDTGARTKRVAAGVFHVEAIA